MSSFCKFLYNSSRLLISKHNVFYNNINKASNKIRLCHFNHFIPQNPNRYKTILGVSILGWLGFINDDEKTESEFIQTLKRGILAYNRQEYNKAEQLLHVALRIAQQYHDQQGITYCYDIMANVNFENGRLERAQKLFNRVLQRLLKDEVPKDDLRVIHICLKVTRIRQLLGDKEAAEIGYNWCLEQIENSRKNSYDAKILYGVIQDWYAQYLLDSGNIKGSLERLKEAYTVCSETLGKNSHQCMLLLNDIGTVSWRAGDKKNAERLFNEAIRLGDRLEEKTHLGVVHANLGLMFLERGVIKMAEKYCNEALTLGNKHKSRDSVDQANYCIDKIKSSLSSKQ